MYRKSLFPIHMDTDMYRKGAFSRISVNYNVFLAFASKQSPAVRVFHKNKNTEMIPKLDRGTTNLKMASWA